MQRFSERNQMQSHALAIVFGPTLFQTDGQDYSAGRAIEDLIEHYKLIFQVWDNLGTRHFNGHRTVRVLVGPGPCRTTVSSSTLLLLMLLD